MQKGNQQKKMGEKPEPKSKGFAGRGTLVSGLLGEKPSKHEQQILHSHVIRETLIAFTQARDTKRIFQKKVIEAAWKIVKARTYRKEYPAVKPRDRNQRLLERVLKRSGKGYDVNRDKTTSTGSYYIITDRSTKRKTTVPVGNNLLSNENPEAAMEQMLGAMGVTGQRPRMKGPKIKTLSFEIYDPPSVDKLEVSEEDLNMRKLRYDGELKKIGEKRSYHFNSFTYTEEGQQSTIEAPADLRGQELLGFLEGRILGKQILYASGYLKGQNGEIFEDIKDDGVKRVAKELYRALWTGIDIVPNEYMEEIGGLIASNEYSELAGMRKKGVLSQEEIRQFQGSFKELEGVALRSTIRRRQSMQTLSDENAILEKAMRDNPSGNERWLLRSAHEVCCTPAVSEEALRNIAEAYEQVVGGPKKDVWHFSVLIEGSGNMMTIIRKAVESFGNTIFV